MPKIVSVATAEQAKQASSVNFLARVQRKESRRDGEVSAWNPSVRKPKRSVSPRQISEGTGWILASPLEWIPMLLSGLWGLS